MSLIEFREWTMWLMEFGILIAVIRGLFYEKKSADWLEKEFQYDERKDLEKKQKKTRTTKKTVTSPNGETVTEESTESVESKTNDKP